MKSKPFTALFASVLLIGCAPLTNQRSNSNGPLTVNQFSEVAELNAGRIVVVQGYLEPLFPDLALYANNQLPSVRESPAIIVMDFKLREKTAPGPTTYGEAFLLEELGCTRQYVEVTGLVGLTPYGLFGISRIDEIRTFPDADFSGRSETCFDATL